MRCPECNGRFLRVVATTYTAEWDVVRRRCCRACDHRWYTIQPAERPVDGHVQWLDTALLRGRRVVKVS